MGHSQAEKLATHQRIVEIASRLFRERGFNGVSVADIMKEAGLTVGGFYKHFESKNALITEAFVAALRDIDVFVDAIPATPRQAMRIYIYEGHRDNPGSKCPLTALANDMARCPDETRDIYTERVAHIIELIAQALPPSEKSRKSEAALVFSACVGSIALARAVSDPKLSKQIIDGTLKQVLGRFSAQRGGRKKPSRNPKASGKSA